MLINSRPVYRQLVSHTNCSFHVKVDIGEKLKNTWHYHPQVELIWLKRSEGTRVIGNSVGPFRNNDIFLIGKNTPHTFLHEDKYLINPYHPPEAVVVQFDETFMGKEFLELPEVKKIQTLFDVAKQGVSISDKVKKKVIPLMEKMLTVSSLDRILLLLQILTLMVNKYSYNLLDEQEFIYQLNGGENKRIKKILDFTSENYDKDIKLEQVAEIVNLTKESFCRYFKAHTGKSYLDFLIEFRISKACKEILTNQMSIKEIAYSCGFNSLSNFHYQFKKIIKQSPIEYKISCQELG